jgi:type I restriction enzyme M protein
MAADGYSLDDKRTKQEGYGDLQDIVVKYHARNSETDTDRTQKCFVVPRADIEAEGYDLSFGRYRKHASEELVYEPPAVILEKLLQAEVGDASEENLATVRSGIVRELLELRVTIG